MKPHTKINIAAAGLLVLGCCAMLGEAFQLPKLKGLALASQAAPYTKVFSAARSHDGGRLFETFACDFQLSYTSAEGDIHQLEITPEIYQQLAGPYNRRNVYGAILAYGPALEPSMRTHLLQQALTSDNSILPELGLPQNTNDHQLTITQKNPRLDQTPFVLNAATP